MGSVKLTPELFGEFPRRSAAVPNSDGSYALYTVSSYSFDASIETKETRIIDLKTNEHMLFSDDVDVTTAQWLKGNQLMWRKTKEGKTTLFAGTVGSAGKGTYVIGKIDAPITDIKTKVLSDGSVALAFSAPANPDGTLLNPESGPKPKHSAREFETIMVRYWDNWSKSYASSLFYTTLRKQSGRETYKLREESATNVLLGTDLRFPHVESPMGDGGSYELSSMGILFTTGDRQKAKDQTKDLYFVPISSFENQATSVPLKINGPGTTGSAMTPCFSVDGSKFAFLKTRDAEDDWWGPSWIFVASSNDPANVTKVALLDPEDKAVEWDYWPTSLLWSSDSTTILFIAQEDGRQRLYKVGIADVKPGTDAIKEIPSRLTQQGAVSAVFRVSDAPGNDQYLYSASSMIDSSLISIINANTGQSTVISSLTENGSLLGIKQEQISDFYLDSKDKSYKFHVWMVTPPDFDAKKKYPVALFIHGGPQSAWLDVWSHRWCPALYAAQGWVVLIPNFTGSSSYGEEFAGAITCDWGGRPYDDVVETFEHAKQNLPFADTERAIAMGGSYGGYLVNWIAGQPLGKDLKALVCHNGIWNLVSMYACDCSYEHFHDFGGPYWESKEKWNKQNPAENVGNWSTPMLFIHSDNDFRCPLENGIAPYNVCQARGIPCRFLNFPDETHFVLKRENQLHWYKTILGWINKWVGMEDGIQLAAPASEPVQTHVKGS